MKSKSSNITMQIEKLRFSEKCLISAYQINVKISFFTSACLILRRMKYYIILPLLIHDWPECDHMSQLIEHFTNKVLHM
ncbi:hypothetical protein T01_2228 [Trichinella spiralis]|uniref:Uncharacterized protein n=1 Tax=Trichinella spiralis TaxID=6334 RepID=A0A0V1BTU6_TRISP|nr:hypothetical protein T01_2228 [Trichinella spiralis]